MSLTPEIQPEAETRILRVITTVFGIAGVVFLLLELPHILRQGGYLHPLWTPVAVALVFGIPVVAAVFAQVLDLRRLHLLLGLYAIGFVVTLALFSFALKSPMPLDMTPWPIAAATLATTTAALAWRPWVAWGFLVLANVGVAIVRYTGSGGEAATNALQLGLFWLTISSIFTVLSAVVINNARAVDRAAAAARSAAASAATSAARGREQARLDALVHDEVIATLYYASLGDPALAPAVQRQAGRALTELTRLRGSRAGDSLPVPAVEFINRLRSVVLGLSDDMSFTVSGIRSDTVPTEVAAAFAEATSEAVRNSITHAGDGSRTITRSAALTVSNSEISLLISDDGVGFDLRAIPQHRLGIRVSIRGRLATVPGGRASVVGTPGVGTVVTMTWRAA